MTDAFRTSDKQLYHCASCNRDYDFETQGAVCPHQLRTEGGIDKMEPWPEPAPSPVVTVPRALLQEVVDTLSHAQVFIRTRERMHPTGQTLYQTILDRVRSMLT